MKCNRLPTLSASPTSSARTIISSTIQNARLDIAETLARRTSTGKRPYCKIRWATEATIHDTIRMREHLPLMRQAGLRALWLGVEDITGSLVNKGQNEEKTLEAFRMLRENGIYPVPMMMHHDSQPLVTWKSNFGLLNQLRILRKAGALYTQILMLTPSPGSKWYENTYASGLAIQKVNGVSIEPHLVDGNYVVASKLPRPWIKQLNLLAGYTYFFNPLRLLMATRSFEVGHPFCRCRDPAPGRNATLFPLEKTSAADVSPRTREADRCRCAGVRHVRVVSHLPPHVGMGVASPARQNPALSESPASQIPMRSPTGGPASHALPNIPVSDEVQGSLEVLGTPSRREAA